MASQKHREGFVPVLLKEIAMTAEYLRGEEVHTVYFGGGTPSLLLRDEIITIIETLHAHHTISPDAEITLEANPDDLSEAYLSSLRQTPVNRLSIGVQSFRDEDLAYLNRVHTAGQAVRSISLARDAGFSNLTIDLIYGIPSLSDEAWRGNLETFFSMGIPHLSSYALTVEEKTALAHLIRKQKLAPVDDGHGANHFSILMEETGRIGYIHYEISNFAREGFYSKHNSLYWLGGNYLGLGPSAHSFNGASRQWNSASMNQYMALDNYRSAMNEQEVLSTTDRYNEYVMTSLRTVWGCDLEHIRHAFGGSLADHFTDAIEPFVSAHEVFREGSRFYLTVKGKLFADGIASALFWA